MDDIDRLNSANSSGTSSCIACKLPIPAGATVCTHCDSFQILWKNNAKYLANIIGILTVSIGILTYILTTIPEIRKTIYWRDQASILSFSDGDPVIIANIGDGPVFVFNLLHDVSGQISKRFTHSRSIYVVVKTGEVISSSDGKDEFAHLKNYSVLSGVNESQWNDAFEASDHPSKRDACFIRLITSPNNPGFLTAKKFLEGRLTTFKVTTTLRYYSLHSHKTIEQKVPSVGYLIRNNNGKCRMQ